MAERGRRGYDNEMEFSIDLSDDNAAEAEKVVAAESLPEKTISAETTVPEQILPEKTDHKKSQRADSLDIPIESKKAPAPKKKKKKNRHLQLMVRIGIFGALSVVFLSSVIYCIVDRVKDKDSMGCRISVYDQNISWLSVDEAADKILDNFQSTKVVFHENGKEIYKVSLGDAGYSLDRDSIVKQLNEIRDERESCKMLFEKQKDYDIEYQVKWDDDTLRTAFANDKMDNGTERIPSKDAEIVFNDEKKYFEITDSSLGTVIDNAKLINRIQETLNASFAEDLLKDEVDVQIDTAMYKVPDVTEDQKAIKKKLKSNNKKVDHYAASSVTYTFGDVKEELTNDMIRDWIQIEGGEISLNEAAMRDYVAELGEKYNTQYVPRTFETSVGTTIVVENNEYGYWINEDGEYEQLLADIESGEKVEREPVYSSRGWKRNGNDDLFGGYVEVNLTAQRVWLYYEGEEILSTDCVTGQPKGGIDPKTGLPEDRSTYEGSYPISYKEKDATLSSEIYGYEQKVEYWMPFVYGQGLHDAGWRTGFGDTIYMWDGSHGCVNLPTYEASVIFSYVDENFPVILYKTGPDPEYYYDPTLNGGYTDPTMAGGYIDPVTGLYVDPTYGAYTDPTAGNIYGDQNAYYGYGTETYDWNTYDDTLY